MQISSLVRRGEELANLYEKIKIQRASLKQGERSFEKTMRKQDTLKNELRKLMENLLASIPCQCLSCFSGEFEKYFFIPS